MLALKAPAYRFSGKQCIDHTNKGEKTNMTRIIAIVCSFVVTLSGPTLSQPVPQIIRLVVPNSPGTGTDQIARFLAPQLQERLGVKAVVIENRSGASGTIGSDIVAKARPDGGTILLAAAFHAINPAVVPSMPYDTKKDFSPISLVAMLPTLLVVSPRLPVTTFDEFMSYAKARPGVVTYGSIGAASTQNLAGGMLRLRTGVELSSVPYREAGPLMSELMSGQIDASFNNITTTIGAVQAERIRPLAVALPERWPALPNVPTFAEVGFPELQVSSWVAMFAPAGTPHELIQKYSKAIQESMAVEAVRTQVVEAGGLPVGSSAEELERFVDSEIESWGAVVRETGIKLD
ncbi:tripartite tricarboxylate transporter substrate binding protein [Pseudoroseomonas wenyumeiae]|uniref:Tripartite tricarboxylate transporter substrate binding protein n=1 Tax=Teichococcus wenyumeiae TaxID=2478470 RepID=A0A3A9JUJ5_9PROT|nr:tripartite tricarboxylate transporter substrate binding protein [Pseudoroseomonas wenyumeiae]RKK02669.1 tripartite tricarboxylate transporter substrate binding protein [Pseudoroseomonas wenyumeiae]RMI15589.1 tripartite tricarboxylate transporter substrate binding protein [Pseudoroseomonas wenyumeiae]